MSLKMVEQYIATLFKSKVIDAKEKDLKTEEFTCILLENLRSF